MCNHTYLLDMNFGGLIDFDIDCRGKSWLTRTGQMSVRIYIQEKHLLVLEVKVHMSRNIN